MGVKLKINTVQRIYDFLTEKLPEIRTGEPNEPWKPKEEYALRGKIGAVGWGHAELFFPLSHAQLVLHRFFDSYGAHIGIVSRDKNTFLGVSTTLTKRLEEDGFDFHKTTPNSTGYIVEPGRNVPLLSITDVVDNE